MGAQTIFVAFITGTLVGIIFRAARLPIPAPNTLEGLMGIIGIFVGYIAFDYIFKLLGV